MGEALVLDKIDLPDPRYVVEQDVFAPLVQISHETETGELPEVVDQVRLVEKPAGHDNEESREPSSGGNPSRSHPFGGFGGPLRAVFPSATGFSGSLESFATETRRAMTLIPSDR